jgi:hypothetical protein
VLSEVSLVVSRIWVQPVPTTSFGTVIGTEVMTNGPSVGAQFSGCPGQENFSEVPPNGC